MKPTLANALWACLLTIPLTLTGCNGTDGNAGGPGTPSGDVGGSGGGGGGGGSTGPIVASVTLTSSAAAIGLSEKATLTATVTDSAGDPIEGTTVSFSISSGPQDATINATAITNAAGEAKAVLTPGTSGGDATVVATASGITSSAVTVTISVATADTLLVSILPSEITLTGEAVLTATIADADGNPIANKTIDFELVSAPTGATIDASATTDKSGTATATISPGNEVGAVTASASVDGLTETADLNIIPASSGSIEFISAVPTLIGVIGSGAAETSVVTFEVRNEVGGLVGDGTLVTFELVGPGGGESLLETTDTTSNGRAAAVVTSGSVAGAVRVIARVTLGGKVFQTASNNITVGSGPPSQNHVSLARAPINFAGRVLFGEQSDVTFFGSDRFSNFVPIASTPAFVSESGGIQPQGLTGELGSAVVKLQSQSPTPADGISDVLTFIVGEESFIDANADGRFNFTDTNGNGVHDPGEASEQFFDIGEPFVDQNDNGVWDGDDPDTPADEAAVAVSGTRTFVGAANGVGGDFNTTCGAVPTSRGYFFDLNYDGQFEVGDYSHGTSATLYDPGSGDIAPDVALNGLWVEGNGFEDDGDCIRENGEAFIDPSEDGRYQNGLDYTDLNGNGQPDPGEVFIQEVFFDGEQNGFRDGAYDGPNGNWDDRLFVYDRVKMFFSGPTRLAASPDSIYLDPLDSVTVWIYVGDDRGLPLATGSTVTIAKGDGSVGQMVGTGTFDILDGSGTLFAVSIANNLSSGATSGLATVTVKVDAANGSFGATSVATAFLEAPP